MRDRGLRSVPILAGGVLRVQCDDGSGRPFILTGGYGAVEGSAPGGEREVPREPTVTPGQLLDAISEAVDAAIRLEDAIRANVATGPALEVYRDRWKRCIELAYALERAA